MKPTNHNVFTIDHRYKKWIVFRHIESFYNEITDDKANHMTELMKYKQGQKTDSQHESSLIFWDSAFYLTTNKVSGTDPNNHTKHIWFNLKDEVIIGFLYIDESTSGYCAIFGKIY